MMHHIDLSTVLRQTISCDLYSNLVTRPTGAAVRDQIERLLGELEDQSLTVIDLTHVTMIDFSCADEVIAKLILRYSAEDSPRGAYFLFRGVTGDHWEAIEAVIDRHGLALVVEHADGLRLVGAVATDERRVWDAVRIAGPAGAPEIARVLGGEIDLGDLVRALDGLWRRRLVVKLDDVYEAVGGQHRD